ncbi:nuclease-related domain-containing protein [Paenibacillus sp. OV219]|uniref:nuclease-related domain-containing protein n=1 Tax=Paenibacillus sp. OV219 TaxID=1884377 RepID=UPI0008AC30AD|nr:nuclease-related domain-containing protein [Paenibacillus sp. OV219]SEP01061.1 Nuclease-related domain-containing protein [Paenibacillus sp. OV219]
MFKKILSMLGLGKEEVSKAKAKDAKKKTSQKPKIESTRIGELGEHKINIQLDQLQKECRYLSDLMIRNTKARSGFSQIDHVIISPYGLIVIETKNYNGEIKGSRTDKNWTVNKRYKLYNPLMQNYGHIKALEGVLQNHPSLLYISMVSFTMRCRFAIDPDLRKIESNELIVYDVELSEFVTRKLNRLRATVGEPSLTTVDIINIENSLKAANITDPTVRAAHVKVLREAKH